MSLSKRTAGKNTAPVIVDFDLLADSLRKENTELIFALIMGSGAKGIVSPGSDLDVAVYLNCFPTPVILLHIIGTVENAVPRVNVDLGVLNGNEPVYRFEALKGRLLFTRDRESWLHFYSLTCREYEHWMFHYEKQRRYRLEFGP